jgi:hypothetical protein
VIWVDQAGRRFPHPAINAHPEGNANVATVSFVAFGSGLASTTAPLSLAAASAANGGFLSQNVREGAAICWLLGTLLVEMTLGLAAGVESCRAQLAILQTNGLQSL